MILLLRFLVLLGDLAESRAEIDPDGELGPHIDPHG